MALIEPYSLDKTITRELDDGISENNCIFLVFVDSSFVCVCVL